MQVLLPHGLSSGGIGSKTVGVTRCAHNARVRNQLLYSLMSDVFLLAKEARYRQPTDVQEPKASYAAVLTGRCTRAETVVCRCSNKNHFLRLWPWNGTRLEAYDYHSYHSYAKIRRPVHLCDDYGSAGLVQYATHEIFENNHWCSPRSFRVNWQLPRHDIHESSSRR
jgi:hypothetical protein